MHTFDLRAFPGEGRQGLLRIGPLTIKAALGRGGIGMPKREGDGQTPRGRLRLLYGFWRADRVARPTTLLPMMPTRKSMVWCDAPSHPAYNRLSRLPLAASHEEMCRSDRLYDICIVLDWNISPPRAASPWRSATCAVCSRSRINAP
jgi:L,D-peptidoglycan transpeptidase YkuD (ErfK/YbiS/YcfS/YnhG family)